MTASTQPAIETASEYAALKRELATLFGPVKPHHGLSDAALWLEKIAGHLSAVEADLRRKDEALRDEIVMAEQSLVHLRDLQANWRQMVDETNYDGECVIDEILRSLIDDVSPEMMLAALAPVSPSEPVPQQAEEGTA